MDQPQFTVTATQAGDSAAKFVIEPLPQGYGHTLGNSLRRVLYTSIKGAAISAVKIAGASHQFATLEGVREDVVELVLNLKQVRLSYRGDKPTQITLAVKGVKEVKAADLELPADVKVANPDLVIAHLANKSSKLDLEATVESGFGYSPAEDRKSTTIGLIPTDAMFSPVIRVNFSVEATRVGRLTNYDRLVLEVVTDRTISPQEALTSAAATLVNYFQAIVTPQAAAGGTATTTPIKLSGAASISVEELDLPTRIANALQKAGFETVADLLAVPKVELAKIKNVGVKSVKIIEIALKERGIDLPV